MTWPSSPLFNWLNSRGAGLLLHPTCLPGNQGIGVLDHHIDDLLQLMNECGLSHWQTCPMGPTGFGDSPYQCFSAFAGNPYLIDLEVLVQAGLLQPSDLDPLRSLSRERVDFGPLYKIKWPLLHQAHAAWQRKSRQFAPYGDFDGFCRQQAHWLDGYRHFMALKQHFDGQPWWTWPQETRFLEKARGAKIGARPAVRRKADAHAFFQYLFWGQWQQVRARARSRGITIIGDTPIFVAADSADVWSHPALFQIDQQTGQARRVAGVPPDYFSTEGQRWGNPLYDWATHEKEDYQWWISRLRANLALHDIGRIDHFRAFDTYWSIPGDAPTAQQGEWKQGPGLKFFEAVKRELPDGRLMAEDLGELSPGVTELRHATGLPGMAVLQFAFGGDSGNHYLPHNLARNSVVYPGTHDNDTSLGWYRRAEASTQDHVNRYLQISGENIGWDLIRAAYASVSRLAIVPLQDFLSLGSSGRFNTPGQVEGNWQWRYSAAALENLRNQSAPYLHELADLTGRLPGAATSAQD